MTNELEKMVAPCSYLDIEGFQSWLEDMSALGYLLNKPGRIGNTYLFHRISPLKTRYRLTPVSDNFEDWNERPDTEKRSLAEAFGWDYVCTVGGLHIYRSYNEEDRELNSDSQVLAESFRLLRKKAILSSIAVLVSPVLYIALSTVLVGPSHIWQYLNRHGLVLFASFALLFLLTTFKGIDRTLKLLKLYRFLNARKIPIHYKDWKKGEKQYHTSTVITYAIGVMLIISIFFFRTSSQNSLRIQDHPEDSSNLPFVTVLNLAEFSDSKFAKRLEAGGMVNWTQIFSDVNYEWTEIVDVVSKEGKEGRFSIELLYHEINSDWLADRLTNEYLKEAESTGTPRENNFDTDVDLAYFYTDHRGCPAAVIRYDNTVIQVCFVRTDFEDANLNLNTWIDQTILRK